MIVVLNFLVPPLKLLNYLSVLKSIFLFLKFVLLAFRISGVHPPRGLVAKGKKRRVWNCRCLTLVMMSAFSLRTLGMRAIERCIATPSPLVKVADVGPDVRSRRYALPDAATFHAQQSPQRLAVCAMASKKTGRSGRRKTQQQVSSKQL